MESPITTPCPVPDTAPARYFPLEDGRYHVRPGLFGFGHDFGNGEADRRLFQIDREFAAFRAAKLEARREDLTKYFLLDDDYEGLHQAVAELIARRLANEYPRWFRLRREGSRSWTLDCGLTGEVLNFDNDWRLRAVSGNSPVQYAHAMDALACQCQEDLAWIQVAPGDDVAGGNRLVGIHLCYPNHWAAKEKFGRDFITVHQPVAGIESINRAATPLLKAMVHKGPYVRFAWGVASDSRLNHHPEAPPGIDESNWRGRRFDPARPRLFLRIERQVIQGLPEYGGALFSIRPSFVDVSALKHDAFKTARLIEALLSMSPDALRYKGLFDDRDAIIRWLRE